MSAAKGQGNRNAGRIGGHLGEMEDLKGRFQRTSQEFEQLRQLVDNQLNSTEWQGPAAARFEQAWNDTFKPNIKKMRQAFDEAATEVQRRKRGLEDVGS